MNNLYREWLLGLMIKYGDSVIAENPHPFLTSGWQWWGKAFEMNHLIYFDNDEGKTIGYAITPKAAEYLEKYNDK